jgi:hypothetical protein
MHDKALNASLPQWIILMQGPEGAGGVRLYADEVFRVRLDFPAQVRFRGDRLLCWRQLHAT